jgi:hypothetical protein
MADISQNLVRLKIPLSLQGRVIDLPREKAGNAASWQTLGFSAVCVNFALLVPFFRGVLISR